jgi:hypothetical protein
VHEPRRQPPDREPLPKQAGERLLARAAELDADLRTRDELATLRAAATEAGISSAAFDKALEEMRADAATPAVPARAPRPWRRTLALAAVVALLSTYVVGRTVVGRAAPAVSTVEQAFQLRCITPDQAAALIRPMLQDESSRVLASPTRAPGVLTVRTTPEQMRSVRDRLLREDGAACTVPPANR